ncbi:hypothetical protein Peur_012604 [Populus x canadensis]
MNFIEIQDSELLFSLCKSIKHSILVFFLFICVWYAKQVSKLGFECMGLAGVYNSPISDEDGISVLKDDFNKGTTRIKNLDENIGSLNVKPSEEELTGISNVNLLKRVWHLHPVKGLA